MKIGNAELELDLFDAEMAGKYERALKKFDERQNNKKTGLDLAGTCPGMIYVEVFFSIILNNIHRWVLLFKTVFGHS